MNFEGWIENEIKLTIFVYENNYEASAISTIRIPFLISLLEVSYILALNMFLFIMKYMYAH